LDDLRLVERTLESCAVSTGEQKLRIHVDRLSADEGVHGVVVLRGGHISLNAWPQSGYATVDVFLRGRGQPYEAVRILRDAFDASSVSVQETKRGRVMPAAEDVVDMVPLPAHERAAGLGRSIKPRAAKAA